MIRPSITELFIYYRDTGHALGKTGMPFLAFSSLQSDTEKSEQSGLMNLFLGMFGTFRCHFAVMDLRSTDHVSYFRQFQVRDSRRFLYAPEDDFSFAQKMCVEEPIWRDPDRKRVTSNHDDETE